MSNDTAELMTAEEVAAKLRMHPETFKRHAKAEGWPCVKFSRSTIRYRAEHVEAIIAMREVEARPVEQRDGAKLGGQTKRSRARTA